MSQLHRINVLHLAACAKQDSDCSELQSQKSNQVRPPATVCGSRQAGRLISEERNVMKVRLQSFLILSLLSVLASSIGCGSVSSEDASKVLPSAIGARAISNHYVEVSFDGEAGALALDPSQYSIVDADGGLLSVTDVMKGNDTARVIVATASQREGESYSIRVGNLGSRDSTEDGGDDAVLPMAAAQTFIGSAIPEPRLLTAIALDNTSVLITFDDTMDQVTVENSSHYRIANPSLKIDTVAIQNGNGYSMAIVHTTPQQNEEYTIKVTNVVRAAGYLPISPENNTATFYGIPEDDDVSPVITSVIPTGPTSVLLSFSEPVHSHATDPSKYETGGFSVVGAEMNAFNTQVQLQTTLMEDGEQYELMASNIADMKEPVGNPINMQQPISFVYDASLIAALNPDKAPPRVVGAISTGNTSILVTFNKIMRGGLEDPANYQIRHVQSLAEAGTLRVLAATAIPVNPRAVELTTLPQNELLYEVTVVNVRDAQGLQLAPPELLVDPSKATFWGTPYVCARFCEDGMTMCDSDADCSEGCLPCSPQDTDGDGLPDHIEQRGWVTTIELTARDGLFDRRTGQAREVTSDPYIADTDGDGLSDLTERELQSDPRDPDTDGDGLSDEREFNYFLSSPIDQDTDEDQLDDLLEVTLYKTSPLLADTDGDGLDDDVEILELNRSARVADLPRWDLEIGEIKVQIDERYTYTDSTGETVSEESSTEVSFAQSAETTFQKSDTHMQFVNGELFGKGGSSGWEIGAKIHSGGEWTSQIDKGSTEEAQSSYDSSFSKAREIIDTREVSREVFGARIDVPVTIVLPEGEDLAFTIENLELAVLQENPITDQIFPIATLVPNAELLTGETTSISIGPLIDERGPILMGNDEIFPSLVENLIRAPRGPIVRASNFDITDEFGRNFAFTSQELNDRTAAILIDFGDGTLEEYHVAISGGIDNNGFVGDAGGYVGFFDLDALPVGIPLDYALQDILGFEKNRSVVDSPDAVIAGDNGTSSTVAAGDDVQLIPTGTTGLDDRAIIISAGDNGVLDTVNFGGTNKAAVTTGYATAPTCNEFTTERIIEPFNFGDGIATEPDPATDDVLASNIAMECYGGSNVGNTCSIDEECAGGYCGVSPGEVIVEAGLNGVIDTVATGDDEVRGPGDVCDPDDPTNPTMQCPGANAACDGRITLSRFKNSKSGDRNRRWFIFTEKEVPAGTDFGDVNLQARAIISLAFLQDIDRDGISAREEYMVGSSDRDKDTDDDTLGDFAEIRDGWIVSVVGQESFKVTSDPRLADSDGDGVPDDEEKRCMTDPRRRDTDNDGIDDYTELNDALADGTIPDCLDPAFVPDPQTGLYPHLDPLNPDTDGDFILDGIELAFDEPLNPLNPADGAALVDLDDDGLPDVIEQTGWPVDIEICNNTCVHAFDGICQEEGDVVCSIGSYNAGSACVEDEDCNSPEALPGTCEIVGLGTCGASTVECNDDSDCNDVVNQCNLSGDGVCLVGGDSCSIDEDCPVQSYETCFNGTCIISGGSCQESIPDSCPPLAYYPCVPGSCSLDPSRPCNESSGCGDLVTPDLCVNLGGSLGGYCTGDPSVTCVLNTADICQIAGVGTCEPRGVCSDLNGPPALFSCASDDDCNTGEQCIPANTCFESGGSCDFSTACPDIVETQTCIIATGDCELTAESCTEDADCTPQDECENIPMACDANSGNAGTPCGNSDQCTPLPGAACRQPTRCDNVPFGVCTDDSDCDLGTCNGIIGGFGFCNGTFFPTICSSDADCQGTCNEIEALTGECSPFALNAGEACDSDADCEPYPLGTCNSGCDDEFVADLGTSVRTDCGDCGFDPSVDVVTITSYSDPTLGDSDFDGLPDRLERDLRSDASSIDTDLDGLLDFDEFDEYGNYVSLNFQYEGFFLTENENAIGSDLASQDTDRDGLGDSFEHLDGWNVFPANQVGALEVTSNIVLPDSDFDGLTDYEEYLGVDGRRGGGDATDPSNADTDGDLREDGSEIETMTNPLRQDLNVTISTDLIRELSTNESNPGWNFEIRVSRPQSDISFNLLRDNNICGDFTCDSESCTGNLLRTYADALYDYDFSRRSVTYTIPYGEPVVIEYVVQELGGGPCEGQHDVPNWECNMTLTKILTTDTLLTNNGFHVFEEELVNDDENSPCRAVFKVDVSVE